MTEYDISKISSIINKSIEEFEPRFKAGEIGKVVESGDGIAHIIGLPNAMLGEIIEFGTGAQGLVLNLMVEEITAIVLAAHTTVREGDTARSTGRIISVPVGDALLGRVVNALGEPIDSKGEIHSNKFRPVENIAPRVIDREPVSQPLMTGYKIIDSMIPIGRGQRELIIGDRSTGKTSMAIDTIINQKGKNVICVYASIGQKTSGIVSLFDKLDQHGAMEYTIIVDAPASDPASLQYLAPFAACAMAEEFMYSGRDVLVIYDDLTKHAIAYRMLSLLLRRPPGREAFPGDIFYLHSRLLERAAKLNSKLGSGSMTALPIVETQMGDISAYIPTNVISITDGQIFLETDLFYSGQRPAVNVGISVSRVGGKAQTPAMRKVSGSLRLDLAQYREKKSFSLFSSELDKETKLQIRRGEVLSEILKQVNYAPFSLSDQVLSLFAVTKGFADDVDPPKVKEFESGLLLFLDANAPELVKNIEDSGRITPENEEKISRMILQFKEGFK